MSLEAKIDELIPALAANTAALLAFNAAGAAAVTGTKAPGKTTKTKDTPSSAHTADEVKKRASELKADKANLPKLKKAIADLGAGSLDELVGKVELLDKFWDAMDEIEAAAAAPVELEDDL